MSYPRKIQTLIVEDERTAKENYQSLFLSLCKRHDLAPPLFASSVQEAEEILKGPTILHLLILDLGLPMSTRAEAMAGVDPGLNVLSIAAKRDHHPIPAIVIISGRIGATRLTELVTHLKEAAHHGTVGNKGDDSQVETDIENAITEIQRYCDVGIHLQDAFGLWPILSPRESDMLRRCVLRQEHCIGLDMAWWGESNGSSRAFPAAAGDDGVKVLAGHFVLNDASLSHLTFFKFSATDRASVAIRDASVMVQKLSHIKVIFTLRSDNRTLLVTQKVGPSRKAPVSLGSFLRRSSLEVQPVLPRIVQDVTEQLKCLGTPTPWQWSLVDLLWKDHNRERLLEAWSKHGAANLAEISGVCDPIETLDLFRASDTSAWAGKCRYTHGDLNATNVALDVDGEVRAYIFDAEGMHADVDVRDLATLEVTSLLHHAIDKNVGLVSQCADFYADSIIPSATLQADSEPPLVQNTRMLIGAIRMAARDADPLIYAVTIFDAALIQLGGLVLQPEGNKIIVPRDAALLAGLAAGWCTRILARASSVKSGGFVAGSPGTTKA